MNNREQGGIVLMEILLALAVLGIGIVSLLQALSGLNRQDDGVRSHAYAVMTAENILARRLVGESTELTGEETWGRTRFTWNLTVENVSDGLAAGSVTVSWKEKSNTRIFSAAAVVSSALR